MFCFFIKKRGKVTGLLNTRSEEKNFFHGKIRLIFRLKHDFCVTCPIWRFFTHVVIKRNDAHCIFRYLILLENTVFVKFA